MSFLYTRTLWVGGLLLAHRHWRMGAGVLLTQHWCMVLVSKTQIVCGGFGLVRCSGAHKHVRTYARAAGVHVPVRPCSRNVLWIHALASRLKNSTLVCAAWALLHTSAAQLAL